MVRFALCLGSVGLVAAVAIQGCSSSSNEQPAPTDGGSLESSAKPDTGSKLPPIDSGGPEDAGVCAPQDVSTFAPTWKAPSGFHQKKCTPEQVTKLADCVWSHPNYDQTGCDAFFKATANKPCVDCAYTATSGKTLGAIVSNGTSVQVNYAGCIALTTGDTSANGCGAKVQASSLCQDAACVDACPVPQDDDKAFQAFQKCEEDASTTVCKTYTEAAACADAATGDGGAATACVPNTQDFGERSAIYAELFCGGLGSDAGDGGSITDAKLDAPTDGG